MTMLKMIVRVVCFMVLVSMSCTACHAQDKGKYFINEKKKETLTAVSKRLKIPIDNLRKFNPHIKKDLVKRGDTVFTAARDRKQTGLLDPARDSSDNAFSIEPIKATDKIFKVATFKKKRYFICEVDPKEYEIKTFNKMEGGNSPHNFNSLHKLLKDKLVFAMNGGMYEPDFSPLGLLISNGVTINDINVGGNGAGNFFDLPPNGVFLLENGEAAVVTSQEYVKEKFKPSQATQSGPMLVIDGKFNIKFNEASKNLHIRNGVGVDDKGKVIFIISEEKVNFYELAQLFRDHFKCSNALYLDGFVSQYFSPQIQEHPKDGVALGVFLTVLKRDR